MRSKQKAIFLKRLRIHEALESRCLLASVSADSPWQNPLDASDLDCDGTVTASDALVAINAINAGTSGDLMSAKMAPTALFGRVQGAASTFLDASGDGQLTAIDPLTVINTLNHGWHSGAGDVPAEDAQQGTVGATVATLDITNGFAKVRAAINTDGDVDVFQVTPTKNELNVSLFSAASGILHVSVVTINLDASGQPVTDTNGDPVTTEIGSTATEADSHRPAKLNLDVQSGTTYYLKVSGDAGVTGGYGLSVLNYNAADFTPVTDSPLGTDIHGNTIATASALTVNQGHADVRSNIDPVAEDAEADKDFFKIDAVAGKLIVSADAEFPLSVSILDSSGVVKATITSSDRSAMVLNVTAGTYYVSVAAATPTDTGAYHINVFNSESLELPGHDHEPHDHPHLPGADDIFANLDTDASTVVSLAEFKAGVPGGNTNVADAVFARLDADGNGLLTFEEFVAGLAKLHLPGSHRPSHDDRLVVPPLLTSH